MKHINAVVVTILLTMLVLVPTLASAQDKVQLQVDRIVLSILPWQGNWISMSPKSTGYLFAAELHMKVDDKGAVEGQINWTLKKTAPDSHLAQKVGKTAIEFVKGAYDPKTRMLILDGYKKDDASEIIALDKYRLIFAENNAVIGGITGSNGTWEGLITLTPKKTGK